MPVRSDSSCRPLELKIIPYAKNRDSLILPCRVSDRVPRKGGIMLILIIILMLVLGSGGGYYGHSHWGIGGGAGIGLGTVLLILLIAYPLGAFRRR